MADLQEIALQAPCATCGALPGQWCKTVSHGNRAIALHAPRMNPILEAYAEGYGDGRIDPVPEGRAS